MSYLIDSHCHIHDRSVYDFALSRQKKQAPQDFTPEKIFERMKDNDVKIAICIGTTHKDSLCAQAFAEKHDSIYWSYGIHPEEASDLTDFQYYSASEQVVETAVHDKHSLRPCLVAIGEVGLDYHNEDYDRNSQINLFEQMLDLATKNDLPLIFHVRDAFDDFFAILNNFHNIKGVVHSFSDTQENLEKSLGYGFYIGVNGLATFTDIPLPPLERALLETDAPFLTPAPFRGRVNDPSHIKDIATFLAKKYSSPFDQVAEITTKNTKDLFRI